MQRLAGRLFKQMTLSLGTVALASFAVTLSCSRQSEGPAGAVLAAYDDEADYTGLTIDYPLNETLFPPEIAPPTFHWKDDDPRSDTWLVTIKFPDDQGCLSFLTDDTQWTPQVTNWNEIKRRSRENVATVAILGVNRAAPQTILSGGRISISTSKDEVGAPLFYREVNLPFIEAVKDPTKIRWRFGPVSAMEPPPIVLENLPVCGNCHSFSTDGAVLGMDVDYANDKGSYALTAIREKMALATSDIITWSDFRKDDGELTFGLLSQVSPDGRYVVGTVKDRSVFVPKPELAFSQLFFPIRGILAIYDKRNRTFHALPGADDPQYVQSNPSWSPDGKYVVFARSKAYHLRKDLKNVLLSQGECAEFLEEGKPFLFNLYRVPFNGGAGGAAQPLPGASHNGMSNFFAKYSPDGKWIVFCKARSYMLLQPDSELYIMPAAGGEARRLRCNTKRMNSWHSWSPNGKWLVFSSKANSDYTQLLLTHIDAQGRSTPPVVLSRLTAPDRAANIPEFVNAAPTAIASIRAEFVDDESYVRAGDTYLKADNDVEGAIRQYRKALELNPNNAVAQSNLGGLLVTQGMIEEGVAHLNEAIRLDPANGSPHYNLGMLRARQGKIDEAVTHLTLAVRYRPEAADAHRVLGTLLCNRGALPEGLHHLSQAVRLDPNDAIARYCLGKALAAQNRTDEAVRHLTLAVQLEPQYATALHLLGQLDFRQGKCADAVEHLTRAVRIKPDDARMLGDLAWMLAMCPDPTLCDGIKAAEYARRACALTGHKDFALLDILGISHAAAGQFPEAIQAAEAALQLARTAGNDQVAASIMERITLYRQGRPYRPPSPPRPPLSAKEKEEAP
ncbi:MAG: tetratricopeptide repeat protein [Phycisphaerales bacterium]|nr:MAG: tetratricopeptide repeat protein [Phycisphaerales bacterium]